MLLKPSFEKDSLILDAFSYQIREINAVDFILNRYEILYTTLFQQLDNIDRIWKRFKIADRYLKVFRDRMNISFSEYLNFNGKGGVTVTFHQSEGQSYRCVRVDSPPFGCETLYVKDEAEAIFQCSLIAGTKGWLGGVPKPGHC